MPQLPKEAFNLTGGCYCKAIRYTVAVPEASARPLHKSSDSEVIGGPENANNFLPRTEIDHCSMCRRIQGSVVLVWIMTPRSWVKFSLLPKPPSEHTSSDSEAERLQPPVMDVLNGIPEIVNKTFVSKFSSSEDVDRIFCSRCGTNLTFRHNKPEKETPELEQSVDLTFGSLDPEFSEWDSLRPTESAYDEFGIGWVRRLFKGGEKALMAAHEQS